MLRFTKDFLMILMFCYLIKNTYLCTQIRTSK